MPLLSLLASNLIRAREENVQKQNSVFKLISSLNAAVNVSINQRAQPLLADAQIQRWVGAERLRWGEYLFVHWVYVRQNIITQQAEVLILSIILSIKNPLEIIQNILCGDKLKYKYSACVFLSAVIYRVSTALELKLLELNPGQEQSWK